MKFIDDLSGRSAEDCKAFPVTSDQREKIDSRMTAYEGDRNRGRPAADVVADLRHRLGLKSLQSAINTTSASTERAHRHPKAGDPRFGRAAGLFNRELREVSHTRY